ncbi:hypothetical protein FGIG_08241 [Fasciola gigantica]|uniref:Uncharacterized protein n=1 Tax=Fasciola gigantica TaxID=46835 RepID=A0A504YE51_FASGI|nr:hypothetical protein FGIG_08241 [Fasciola gigantica]
MSVSVNAPTVFWTEATVFPTSETGIYWRTVFLDYLDLLNLLNPSVVRDESAKLDFLRNYLGAEGQRKFNIRSLCQEIILDEAFQLTDKISGAVSNVYISRFGFSKVSQESEEPLEGFISCLIQGIRDFSYPRVTVRKFEDVMLIQQFIR